MGFFERGLSKILLVGSFSLIFGACSIFTPELPKTAVKDVSIYQFNIRIASIKGPFIPKKEVDHTSFTEISEDEDIKFKPILYQKNNNKNVYIDCQRNGRFNVGDEPLNALMRMGKIRENQSYTPNQICEILGYPIPFK